MHARADTPDTVRPAAAATVPAIPPSRSGKLLTPGRSSDSQAQPAARLLTAAAAAAMARRSRPRRLVTAAGPSRNRTGVPCSPAGVQITPPGHQSRWQSVAVAVRLSTIRAHPEHAAQHRRPRRAGV